MDVRLVCGIDAGGTKTDCVVATLDGEVLARTAAGPAAVHHGDGFAAEIAAAIGEACVQASISEEEIELAVVGLSGVDTDRTREYALASLQETVQIAEIRVYNDAEIALAAATDERPAAVLIAGTGSIVYGESKAGDGVRAGGWGHLFGDEGSGYGIAAQALAAVLRACDGRDLPTALTQRACAHFGLDDPRTAVELTEEAARNPTLVSTFAPAVFEAARDGDRVAVEIVANGARELAELALSLLEAVAPEGDCTIAFAGSLLANEDGYARAVQERILTVQPRSQIVRAPLAPVAGAVLAAVRICGGEAEARSARDRLGASLALRGMPIPEVVD